MNVSPSLELGHMELHLPENTDSVGCCCFFKTKAKQPKEYIFDNEGHLIPQYKKVDELKRSVSNAQLNQIIINGFEPYPVDKELAFKKLKERVKEDAEDCSLPITRERLKMISDELYSLRKEIEGSVGKKKHSRHSSSHKIT